MGRVDDLPEEPRVRTRPQPGESCCQVLWSCGCHELAVAEGVEHVANGRLTVPANKKLPPGAVAFRAETERYGHYSVAGEFVYDRPFQWGSKRTGPDLARVGGRYSDEWHRTHLQNPRNVVPESNMPAYTWLAKTPVDASNIEAKMRTLRMLGAPYTDAEIAKAGTELAGRSEEDAVVAYLQNLGTVMKNAR